MDGILHLPPWLFALTAIGTFIVAGVTGLALFNRLIRGRIRLTEATNNDIIFFASAISVFYSLIVGLVAVGVWRTYTEAQNTVSEEATAMGCFYRDVSFYPEPTRSQLRTEMSSYTDYLIDVAWTAQLHDESTDELTQKLRRLLQDLVAFEPKTAGQQILHAEAMHQYNEIVALRRKRINTINAKLPGVMWSVVLVGAAIVLGTTYLLRIQETVHLVMTAFLAMFIGLVVFVIASLDRPLNGPLAIDSHPYRIMRERFIKLQ